MGSRLSTGVHWEYCTPEPVSTALSHSYISVHLYHICKGIKSQRADLCICLCCFFVCMRLPFINLAFFKKKVWLWPHDTETAHSTCPLALFNPTQQPYFWPLIHWFTGWTEQKEWQKYSSFLGNRLERTLSPGTILICIYNLLVVYLFTFTKVHPTSILSQLRQIMRRRWDV